MYTCGQVPVSISTTTHILLLHTYVITMVVSPIRVPLIDPNTSKSLLIIGPPKIVHPILGNPQYATCSSQKPGTAMPKTNFPSWLKKPFMGRQNPTTLYLGTIEGFPKLGVPLGRPNNQAYGISGSMWASPESWKTPFRFQAFTDAPVDSMLDAFTHGPVFSHPGSLQRQL